MDIIFYFLKSTMENVKKVPISVSHRHVSQYRWVCLIEAIMSTATPNVLEKKGPINEL